MIRLNTSSLLASYRIATPVSNSEWNSLNRRALDDLGSAVDHFLTPRPWWQVTKEPYPSSYSHPTRSSHLNKATNHSYISSNTTTTSPNQELLLHLPPFLFVTLSRYPFWEHALRLVTATQFPYDPEKDACGSMSATVGQQSCVHPGWHSVTDNYNMARGNRQFDIFAIFFPIFDQPVLQGGNNSFISLSDCPNNPNQWTCAFLPLTNCTLPAEITDCHSRTCKEDNFYFSSLLFPANSSGVRVKRESLHASMPVTRSSQILHQSLKHGSEFLYMMPYDRSVFHARAVESVMNSPESILFIFLFMIRKTYLYRQRIAALLHTFRSSSAVRNQGKFLSPSTPCVAAHVRRGDRVMYIEATHKPINMTEYCYNASLPRTAGKPPPECLSEENTMRECPDLNGLSDFGCGKDEIPFESITLANVIEKAEKIAPPHVRSLVFPNEK